MSLHLTNKQLFQMHVGQTSAYPMELETERAENIYLYGVDGKKYIDLISGIAVSSLGHGHPKIVQAVQRQAAEHMHVMVYGEFVQNPQVKLAEAMSDTLPAPLDNVFFVNSGSEAIEGAMKLAKRYTGRHEIIACYNCYHGSTQGALSLGSNETFKQAFVPLIPGISHIGFGDENDLKSITDKTAAVIIETVQGEAGIKIASQSYFKNLRARCDETGTLLVLDEIQTGFGRTGKFWGFEHYNIVPDIITSAKGMGGGMPIGAFISSKKIMDVLQTDPVLGHITTFGGHPVSCAASLATVEELVKTKVFEKAEEKADIFKRHLDHSKIKGIRHLGLMMAVEFDSFDRVSKIIKKSMELGLITDWFLFCDHAIRIAPPLIITEDQIIESCQILLKAIDPS
ncbi:MAG: aspartate aminotransferase family protein [Cyclobacteriaceae bacterium]|nr:aspartate aminotransferase family protein [Cyclobacteriaceae bacterium]